MGITFVNGILTLIGTNGGDELKVGSVGTDVVAKV